MKQALIDSRDLRRDGIKGLAAMTGNTYCGNLLWQSSLVAPRQTDVAKAGVQAGMRCCINKTVSISSDPFELEQCKNKWPKKRQFDRRK